MTTLYRSLIIAFAALISTRSKRRDRAARLAAWSCTLGLVAILTAPQASAESDFPSWVKDRACSRINPPFHYFPGCAPPPPRDNFWCRANPGDTPCSGSFSTTSVPICVGGFWNPETLACVSQCDADAPPQNGACIGAPPDKPLGARQPGQCRVGNPCDPATGNKILEEVDYAGTGPFPLRFARYYNSLGRKVGPGTPAWQHEYQRIVRATLVDAGNFVDLVRASGSVLSFRRSGSGWVSEGDVQERIEHLIDGAGRPPAGG